ncbi:MAG: hypothetical protein DRJ47_07810 [Thermoprotei archaeon]|nr:MAG: hypothetical protein DRJ47_07810 [Thermoprotei archaeon]
MFVINHRLADGNYFKVVLDVVEISKLSLHEETVSSALRRLVSLFKKSRFLAHPVIVDQNSLVVLDGMHRVTALKELGYKYIVAALVDYLHPSIKVYNWYRTFTSLGKSGETIYLRLKATFRDVEYHDPKVDREYIVNGVKNGEYSLGLLFADGSSITVDSSGSIINDYRLVSLFDHLIQDLGASIGYYAEEEALEALHKGSVEAVEVTPPLKKKDIIDVAVSGKVFPPKTTRHVIPVRPLYINYPLKYLKNSVSRDVARKILGKMLSSRLIVKIKGQVKIDRFYEEDYLYVFI